MRSTKMMHLYALMSFEGTLLGAELVASQLTHSLIILTDAYHTFYNIISILLLVISLKMTNEQTVKNTFGWARIEVLGMLVNMTFVVALTFSLVVEGVQQLVHSSHEISEPTNHYLLLIFGVSGLVSNLLYFQIVSDAIMNQTMRRTHSLKIEEKKVIDESQKLTKVNIDSPSCSGTEKEKQQDVCQNLLPIQSSQVKEIRVDTKVKGVNKQQSLLLGVTRDLSSSVLLIVCAIIVFNTDGTIAHLSDPILGIISALLFCFTFYPNMRNTGFILLQTVPENINVGQLKRDILREFPQILNIHDLHIWGLTASKIIATCHIILPKQSSKSYEQFSELLQKFFQQQGISLATVQPEFDEIGAEACSFSCMMKCSNISNVNCDSFTCCKNEDDHQNNSHHSDHTPRFDEVITTENL